MKFVVASLLGVCLLFLSYLYLRSIPFDSLSPGPEKLERAYVAVKSALNKKTENILETASENQSELQYLASEIVAFEDALGPMVRADIAAGIHGARADVSGFTPFGSKKCSKEAYLEIKESLSQNDLLKHGLDISLLAGLLEDQQRPEY